MPYFSVIMPTYNRANILSQSIQSLIEQTYKDFELIVVDDHGKDNTKKIIKNFNDRRFRYFYLSDNKGPAFARDFGIRKSKGEIMVIADSDDINLPNRLELTNKEFMGNQELDVVYGLAIIEESNGKKHIRASSQFDKELLRYFDYIINPTAAFKKSLYVKIGGYDKKLRSGEDYDLWLSALENGAKFKFIKKPLIIKKISTNSTSFIIDTQKRKSNLNYVRKKHNIKTPSFQEIKKIVKDKKLLKYMSTPGAINFWFS